MCEPHLELLLARAGPALLHVERVDIVLAVATRGRCVANSRERPCQFAAASNGIPYTRLAARLAARLAVTHVSLHSVSQLWPPGLDEDREISYLPLPGTALATFSTPAPEAWRAAAGEARPQVSRTATWARCIVDVLVEMAPRLNVEAEQIYWQECNGSASFLGSV